MIKKRCYSCGKKTEDLIDGLCEDCYKKKIPVIKEIKPLNLKICNNCGVIHYKNKTMSQEELKKILPEMIKESLIINENYILNKIDIENFLLEKNKLNFDLVLDVNLKK